MCTLMRNALFRRLSTVRAGLAGAGRGGVATSLLLSLFVVGCAFRPPARAIGNEDDAGANDAPARFGVGGSAPRNGVGGRDGGTTISGCPAVCPTGQVCLGGACQADPCAAATSMGCAAGTNCRASCVDVVDTCAGVKCAAGQSCE